jgi:RimJ/RimL family protein N-acetyltransferase
MARVSTAPPPTSRLAFREMTPADLDEMAALLGDPAVMAHYPAPKSRDQAADWIRRNRERYDELGFGLWVVRTRDGAFVGDCGLTMQPADDDRVLEVGYHLVPGMQGRGYATEAAAASRDHARDALGASRLSAIIASANRPSQAVAQRIGMTRTASLRSGELLYGMDL